MSEPVHLETTQYVKKRRRRSCFGTLLLAMFVFLGIVLLSKLFSSAGVFAPLFGDAVGVVRIEGPINDGRKVIKLLKQMGRNSSIKAVVLRLDTPGGSVGASEEIYREVLRIRDERKKPVVVSMGNAAASGGYYIAAAANEIFANSGTITGSIGVIAPGFNAQETIQKLGIRSNSIKSGEHKDTGSPFHEMTVEDRNLLQHLIYDAYRQFLTVVLKGRHEALSKALTNAPGEFERVVASASTKRPGAGIEWEAFTTGTVAQAAGATTETETALRRLADGRILTGDQALQVGLVDRIGGQQDAVRRAAELAGIDAEDPTVIEREPESDMPAWLGSTARKSFDAFLSAPSPRLEYR